MDPAIDSFTQNSEVTTLIDELKKTLSVNDPAGPATRRHLKETVEQLSLALETPGETVQRVAYYVSVLSNLSLPQKNNHKSPSPVRLSR